MRPPLTILLALAASIAVACLFAVAGSSPGSAQAKPGKGGKGDPGSSLRSVVTGRRAELRETVPIAPRAGAKTRSVLSVKLPTLRRGDRVRLNGEVAVTTTCVEQISRCIGRTYDFSPHLRARIVLAKGPKAVGARTKRVSKPVRLTCEQTRPNRNHHCPLTIESGSFKVRELRKLPCPAKRCRLNMALDASNRQATSNEVVVVGADQPNGTVEGGKARLSAVVSHGRVEAEKRRTSKRLHNKLPVAFDGGKTVIYSQRLDNLRAGDVLLIGSRQRTAIQGLPYFISNQIVVSTRRRAFRPTALSRRTVSRSGLASETNGFNCTIGPSAFQSPCVAIKAGMATIQSVPRDGQGRPKPLYVNLVSRGFPKIAQARPAYPPARILDGGSLTVRRLRAG